MTYYQIRVREAQKLSALFAILGLAFLGAAALVDSIPLMASLGLMACVSLFRARSEANTRRHYLNRLRR